MQDVRPKGGVFTKLDDKDTQPSRSFSECHNLLLILLCLESRSIWRIAGLQILLHCACKISTVDHFVLQAMGGKPVEMRHCCCVLVTALLQSCAVLNAITVMQHFFPELCQGYAGCRYLHVHVQQ